MALDKLTTIQTSGIVATGIVTSNSYVGDGSGLTGVVGSGSGVVVQDDTSVVGTAGTIDFGTALDVSAISSGIVTVTALRVLIQQRLQYFQILILEQTLT